MSYIWGSQNSFSLLEFLSTLNGWYNLCSTLKNDIKMKKIYYLLFFVFTLIYSDSIAQKNIDFGTDTTFEIATWNLEHFPKNDQTTIDYVSLFVQGMGIDMFAMEEIENRTSFNSLVADLDGYEGYWAYDEYAPMALLYKSNLIQIQNTYRILASYPREFPRAPLVAEISVRGDSYVIIANHYKCCGDGILNDNDDWDEETRRYDASVLLKDYVDSHYANDKVIMLGDFNDEITDDEANNVFQPFLDDTADYAFADMSIAQSSAANWSYPSWPSHLDHILVTNEVFETFEGGVADVECLKPDELLPGGWSTYDSDISDHRPVALRLAMAPDTVGIHSLNDIQLSVYPNPAARLIEIKTGVSNGTVAIYNTIGNKVDEFAFDQEKVSHDVSQLESGIYLLNIISAHLSETKRFVIER